MLSNNLGLGADRVLQYRVVTPQGNISQLTLAKIPTSFTPSEEVAVGHSELLWKARSLQSQDH
jgi:hypothetical protein